MSLLNGEHRDNIDIADRGFQYGDGVFETVEVVNGKPLFLDRHLKRLQRGCEKLLIPMPDLAVITQESLQISADASHAVLKLIVTRGCGGRGYRQPAHITPTRLLTLYPYPDYPTAYQEQGISTRFCHQRLAINPYFAGIKHMNRLEQIIARAEWQDEGVQEGFMLNSHDQVIEGTMSNIFLVKERKLITPKLNLCGVAGIAREIIMELAYRENIPLVESEIDQHHLFDADEIFITNSVIGVWPVIQLEKQNFYIGSLTRSIQQIFNDIRLEYT